MDNVTDKQILELIEKVRTLKEKSDADPKVILEKYNFFRFLGLDHDECIFSMMIANLLKVNAAHGFKQVFLEIFIKKLLGNATPVNFDYKKAEVSIEKDIGPRKDSEKKGGRIDIFIKIPDENGKIWAFVIENKIYAEDQNLQLRRYKNYVDKVYPDRNFIVYLTLNGKDPSEESIDIKYKELEEHPEKQYWIQISYRDFIREWLEECIDEIGDKNSRVKENVNQFLGQIKKLTGQDIGKMEEKEIIDLLEDNLEITGVIYSYALKAKEKAARDNIEEFFKLIGNEYKKEIHFLNNMKNKSKFWCYKENWKNIRICFEFEENELHKLKYGLIVKENGKEHKYVSKDDMIDIYKHLEEKFDISKSTEPTDFYLVRFYDEEWPGFYLRNLKNGKNHELIDHLKTVFERLEKMALEVEENFSRFV